MKVGKLKGLESGRALQVTFLLVWSVFTSFGNVVDEKVLEGRTLLEKYENFMKGFTSLDEDKMKQALLMSFYSGTQLSADDMYALLFFVLDDEGVNITAENIHNHEFPKLVPYMIDVCMAVIKSSPFLSAVKS